MTLIQHVVVGAFVVALFGLAGRLLFQEIDRGMDGFDRGMDAASDWGPL